MPSECSFSVKNITIIILCTDDTKINICIMLCKISIVVSCDWVTVFAIRSREFGQDQWVTFRLCESLPQTKSASKISKLTASSNYEVCLKHEQGFVMNLGITLQSKKAWSLDRQSIEFRNFPISSPLSFIDKQLLVVIVKPWILKSYE